MIKIILTLLTFFTFTVQSQTVQLTESEKQKVRQSNVDIAKDSCVYFWTKINKTKILTDVGITLDDQCKCTQDTVAYQVSDELAAYVTHAFYEIRENGLDKLNPILKSKIDEHQQIINSAMQGCSKKLMKR